MTAGVESVCGRCRSRLYLQALKDCFFVLLQVAGDEARTSHRPDFIQLSNRSPDMEDLVLFPNQWEEKVNLAER